MHWKKLSYLSEERIKRLQDKKTRAFIRQQIPYSPYYRELFKKIGLKFSDIRTTDDLVKIPIISKEDIAPYKNDPERHLNFVLQPDKDLIKKHMPKYKLLRFNLKEKLEQEYKPIHIHFTTGRSYVPTPFLYTNYDLGKLKEAGRRMMEVFDVSKDAVAINGFPYAPHLAFWQSYYALLACDIISLQTGGGEILGSDKIIDAIERMKATTLLFTPGYCYHLLKEAREKMKDFSSVKEVILGGEGIPAGLRLKMKDLLGRMGAKDVRVLSTYAFTEGKVAWAQCCEEAGYHLYPDMEFIEIVKDGERCGSGEKGDIVYSALDSRGSVVLRYKTGDIGSLEEDKCSFCGRTVPRINTNIERSSEFKEFNLSKIKGTLVNLNEFFNIMMGDPQIDEWQVEIKKKGRDPYDLDELVVYVAPNAKVDIAQLKVGLRKKIHSQMELTPEIIVMDKKQLLEKLGMETELKEKRIVDKR